MNDPIYLDYAATTPLAQKVQKDMLACLSSQQTFGNPSSHHIFGQRANNLIENARLEVAELIAAEPESIYWTSGATEANNLAIKGIAEFYGRDKRHMITTQIEHKSILEPCRELERRGFQVTYLKPRLNGLIDIADLKSAIRPDTLLVSLSHVNNEIGVIQDIHSIGRLLRDHQIFFHVDAAQSLDKIPLQVAEMGIDLLSLSAHKIYGPKGIGALYLRLKPPIRLAPLLHGGGQQRGIRSGTLPTHQIVGMGSACRLVAENMEADNIHIRDLRDKFWNALQFLPGVILNGDEVHRVSHNLNICFTEFNKIQIRSLMERLAVSAGSACDTIGMQSSHVLKALGRSKEEADRSIRFSMGRYTTKTEIDKTIEIIQDISTLTN